MKMYKCFLITGVITILIGLSSSFAQSESLLATSEDALLQQYKDVLAKNSFERESAAKDFLDSFCAVLSQPGSFDYNFEKLKNIGSVYSPNNRLRIFTWNIPSGLDEQLYFGVAQHTVSSNTYKIVKLNEPIGQNQLRKISKWPGALYFQIIETKHAGQGYYTLLGVDMNNSLSNKKLIDILSIDEHDELYFCEKLIYFNNQRIDRLEFEYNEKAIMSLRYDEESDMIVFDHLSPVKPSLEGKFEFYGPDFTYDGLKFEKGIWVHYSNIEITN